MSKRSSRPVPEPAQSIEKLVDGHTHLWSCGARTSEEVHAFVARARAVGVERICTVGDGLDECRDALASTQWEDNLWAAVAIHPTRVQELTDEGKAELVAMVDHPKCVAVGETGLDAYWIGKLENCPGLDEQEEAFRWHIDVAFEKNKTLMIHNREADADLMRILGSAPRPKEVILHCFSSPVEVAKEAFDRGYVVSLSGNVTFKRNDFLREVARLAPAGQLLIETDAPYMTPEPYRGAKNEPSLIGHTALCVAAAKKIPVEQLAEELTETFRRVYDTH